MVVAFSRVYTGGHYPGDVLVGATVGTVAGRFTSGVARRGDLGIGAWIPGPAAPPHGSGSVPDT
jgi:membrane-associated phospholipid phosphatase